MSNGKKKTLHSSPTKTCNVTVHPTRGWSCAQSHTQNTRRLLLCSVVVFFWYVTELLYIRHVVMLPKFSGIYAPLHTLFMTSFCVHSRLLHYHQSLLHYHYFNVLLDTYSYPPLSHNPSSLFCYIRLCANIWNARIFYPSYQFVTPLCILFI